LLEPDLVSATAAYLRAAMAQQFNCTSTNGGVWSDKADQGSYPYAVVQDTSEQYVRSSNDPATGYKNTYHARGTLHVIIYAYDKAQTRLLGRQVMAALDNDQSDGQLNSTEGKCLDMEPMGAQVMPPDESGPTAPNIYRRAVTFNYVQEFYL
jgi:hypothetical protein